MKNKTIVATILGALMMIMLPSLSFADTGKAPAHTYTVDSTISELLANPKAKAIVGKYLPDLINSPNLSMVEGMSLKDLAAIPQANLDDGKLKAMQAELAKVK